MSSNGQGPTLEQRWSNDDRWRGVERRYGAEGVLRLRGSFIPEQSFARMGAERLWSELQGDVPVTALGTLTGNQAVQAARAGLHAIYCSGWQVAADANLAGEMYPDQSLYPVNSVPALVERLNNAFARLDQIESLEGRGGAHWYSADRRRRRSGFRRPAQRVRADESDDRSRRRRRPLRRPAQLGEKVRPSWRQSADSDAASRAHICSPRGLPPTCSTCRRSSSRARTRTPPTLLTSDVDPIDRSFHHRRTHARGLLP